MKDFNTLLLFIIYCSLFAVVRGQSCDDDFTIDPCTDLGDALNAPKIFEDDDSETITTIKKKNELTDVQYKVGPDNLFTLNDINGTVHLKKDLIVKKSDFYPFQVDISYKHLSNVKKCSRQCTIQIKAVNRYEPKFNTSAVQKILVEENKLFPEALLTFEAEDADRDRSDRPDEMRTLHFTLKGNEDISPFKILTNQTPENRYIVQFFMNSTLDYENINFYMLTLVVEDESENRPIYTPNKTATIDIYLNVDDVHDQPPQFITECGLKRLEEHTPVGTEVKTVKAIDADSKIRNPVKYAILHDGTGSEEKIVEKYFEVNSVTGKLTVKESPDRESEDLEESSTITFIIQATEYNKTTFEDEKENGTATTNCIIIITDIDDNPARFEQDVYNNATLLENSPKGTVVVLDSATVNDKDLGINATYFLYLQNEDKVFVVTPEKGQNNITFFIRVHDSKPLDYEREDLVDKSFHFQVFSKGIENGNHICSADITVTLLDENDNYPVIEPLENIEVSENATGGHLVAIVKATDIDSGNYGTAGIVYQIPENPLSNSFRINATSGEITVKDNHTLDREYMAELMLPVDAIDDLGEGLKTSMQIRIKVLDANDQKPIFSINNYRFSLLENDAQFQSSMPLQAFDRDEPGTNNSKVNYEILKSEFSDIFQIHASDGVITPKTPLDFENKLFQHMPCNNIGLSEIYICVRTIELVVQAFDLGIPTQYSEVNANVTIDFTDVNDNVPKFTNLFIEETIEETVPPGETVLKVKATDADISPRYNQVYYSFSDMNQYNFIMNRRDGKMTVAKGANLAPEDNDNKKVHILMVQATDGLEEQKEEDWCNATVNILDVNNKAPVFVKNSFNHSNIPILEEQETFWVVQFAAYDPDETHDLEFRIDYNNSEPQAPFPILGWDPPKIEDYDIKDKFTIDRKSGILNVTKVDRERLEKINLLITVTDINADAKFPYQTDNYTFHITVLDINDNDPIFINRNEAEGYSKSVYENMDYPQLLEIVAIDIDKNNGSVVYALDLPDVAKGVFTIDKNKGRIDMKEVDYEEYHFMNFTVIATDSGHPPRSSYSLINITIMDVNDNNPIFVHDDGNYTREVWENSTIGTWVMTVTATDKDSGEYGRVNYMLRNNNPDNSYFDIGKENGSLTIKRKLTYQAHKFELHPTVRAYDNPSSSNNLDAEQRITIKILDINDNPPIFDDFPDSFSVSEIQVQGSSFGRLKATDKDEPGTPNSQIVFSIVGGDPNGYFRVEQDSGYIFFKVDMNTRFGIYNVVFMAQDRGEPPLNSTKTFQIDVYDVNNHAPVFTKPEGGKEEIIPIEEGTEIESTIGKYVTTVEAVDRDRGENASIVFNFVKETPDQQDVANYFNIDGKTGIITVTAELRKKNNPEFLMTIFARDEGTPPLRSENNVRVKVLVQSDIDLLPIFDNQTASFNFTEGELAEKQLVPEAHYKKEFVEDPIAPICYFIVGGDVELFHLEKTNREMTVTKKLDREEHAFHAVSVLAHKDCEKDIASLVKLPESVVNITVGVTDVNDNSPVFDKRVFAGRMTTVRTVKRDVVATVRATDLDEGPNAEIEYSIYSQIKTEEAENLGNTENAFDMDKKTGEIRVNFQPQKNMKGYFSFTVMAKDIGSLNDTAQVLIYLMREDQQIMIKIRRKEADITKDERAKFSEIFEKVTGHYCIVDKWEALGNTTLYDHYTSVTMHLVNKETNKILEPSAAERLVDSKLHELRTATGSMFPIEEVKQTGVEAKQTNDVLTPDQLQYIYLAAAAGLALCLVVTVAISCLKLNSMRRTLKAATVPAFGSQDSGLNRIGVQAAPNTNQHTIEGSNPMWNQQDDLKFNQPDIESETVSINSMDLHMMGYPENNDFPSNEALIADKPPITEKVNNQSKDNNGGTNRKKKTRAPDPPKEDKLYKKNTLNTLKMAESDWRRRHTQGELQLDPTRLPIPPQPDNDQQRRLSLFIRPEKSSEL